ncbi:hypothetical protein AKO1_010113 [Acrasis kona]|uniref:Uncharacterized protein n=1 Tax=Acrasis kona TaxID=1008807 RepID=A0AAW2ZSA5_9EUKA
MMIERAKVSREDQEETNKLFVDEILRTEEERQHQSSLERSRRVSESYLARRLGSAMADAERKIKKKNLVVPHTDVEYEALNIKLFNYWLFEFFNTGLSTIALMLIFKKYLIMKFSYDPSFLDGQSPVWISLFQTITGFTNAGLSSFTLTMNSDNVARFGHNYGILSILIFTLLAGNTCYPIILRSIIVLSYKLSSKNKRCFKYLLNKHHHISIHLYPSLQTRIYLSITKLFLLVFGAFYGSYAEYSNPIFADSSYGHILFTCLFHVASSRTAGFTTMDISKFSIPFLLYLIVMMRTKAQMACDLRGQAYGIVKTEKELRKDTENMEVALRAVVFGNKSDKDANHLVSNEGDRGQETTLKITPEGENDQTDVPSEPSRRRGKKKDVVIIDVEDDAEYDAEQIVELNKREQLLFFMTLFFKKIWHHAGNLLYKNNVWLVLVTLLICMLEDRKMIDNTNWSLLKVIFEVVSAFGLCGLSLGYTDIPTSFSTVFTDFSKLMIIFTMLCGKHRGLSGSMKDQEYSKELAEEQAELDLEKRKYFELKAKLLKKRGRKNFATKVVL